MSNCCNTNNKVELLNNMSRIGKINKVFMNGNSIYLTPRGELTNIVSKLKTVRNQSDEVEVEK